MSTVPTPYWDEAKRESEFTIGLDLGQAVDYTAIVILERFLQPVREVDPKTLDQKTEVRYEIRHLERPQLGTPYPTIVERVSTLMRAPELTQWKKKELPNGDRVPVLIKPSLVVDKTGVGAPVVDLLKAAKLSPIAVTITNGSEQTRPAHNQFNVPKRDLVSTLQVAFQNKKLLIAQSLSLAPILAAELTNFRAKISIATAHESYEAWRESQHDDFLLAAALALWGAQEKHRHTGGLVKLHGF